ncbi:MAG: N-acylneuraminate cytidylyltransferase [Bacteroidales bacterium]|nr:N-acylneuraminate cytidylyltransferase [Paludibacteraceae bacterium]MBN2777141.1 N-acylneuraminate cytidylyltransferase [Bacteroidales bacterium]
MNQQSVAIIPLRAGSKSIINKNKKKLLGRPLFTWVLGEAIQSNLSKIYIYTDDEKIIDFIQEEYTWTNKVEAMLRSAESATDTASTEMAMLEFAEKIKYNFSILCLLQATSPLTTALDINNTLKKINDEGFDSALTVVESKRFVWNEAGKSLNYDFMNRPRRQEFEGMLLENGAVYACTKSQFQQNKNRLGGKIGIVKMAETSLVEIDEPTDWAIVETLAEQTLRKTKQTASKIKALVLDVDGVFTDGKIAYTKDGELSKTFSMRDGMGLEIARENGLQVIVITSENSVLVEKRMQKLQITNLYMGVKDKYTRLIEILNQLKINKNEVAYLGDDVNDLANICSCGWGLCPSDAMPEVKQRADIILPAAGGNNAIREATHFIHLYNQRNS